MLTLAPQAHHPFTLDYAEKRGRNIITSPPRTNQIRLPIRNTNDVMIDRFVTQIYSIINRGPTGGFVRYAINPRNELYVERTGNRSDIKELVSEIMPQDACRYIAYKLKYRKFGSDRTRMVWFVWSPEAAPKTEPIKYLNGLATTLIGLDCDSTIPILKGKTAEELEMDKIITQI